MILPQNNKLPISALAGIFSNKTATYKFYWFVSLLDIVVKERKTRISFWEIINNFLQILETVSLQLVYGRTFSFGG